MLDFYFGVGDVFDAVDGRYYYDYLIVVGIDLHFELWSLDDDCCNGEDDYSFVILHALLRMVNWTVAVGETSCDHQASWLVSVVLYQLKTHSPINTR